MFFDEVQPKDNFLLLQAADLVKVAEADGLEVVSVILQCIVISVDPQYALVMIIKFLRGVSRI